jgi:hypothetical protein
MEFSRLVTVAGLRFGWTFWASKRLSATGRRRGDQAMQAGILLVIYVVTTVAVQFLGFLISRLVDYQYPTLGLMTFLVLFLGAFGIAWPIAVRITEWVLRRAGHVIQTEQSGGASRLDHLPRRRPQ